MRPAACLVLAAGFSACSTLPPTPALTLERPDAQHVRATLHPVPARAAWTLEASPDCGAEVGPVRSGAWPDGAASVVLPGTRGDLLTVTAGGATLRDCVPPAAWNAAQGVR